ncbi:hypothetical protein ACIA78_31245 [Streptomyces xanthochromogenes]|uniref:hypothetical protein n=1 Tax=Streptomyces xanthochromogenes TaxID=67384 RepID=UPI003439546A
MAVIPIHHIVTVGLALLFLAGLAMLILPTGLFGHPNLAIVCVVLFVLISSLGLLIGNANALAMNRTSYAVGAASALLGSSGFLIGALVSPLAAITNSATPWLRSKPLTQPSPSPPTRPSHENASPPTVTHKPALL